MSDEEKEAMANLKKIADSLERIANAFERAIEDGWPLRH